MSFVYLFAADAYTPDLLHVDNNKTILIILFIVLIIKREKA